MSPVLTGLAFAAAVGWFRAGWRQAARAPVRRRLLLMAGVPDGGPRGPGADGRLPVLVSIGAAMAVGGLGLPLPLVAAVGVAAAAAVGVGLPRWRARALARRARAQFPDALDAVAAQLRRGSSLLAALEAAATSQPDPIGRDLARLALDGRHRGLVDALTRRTADGSALGAAAVPLAVALEADADPTPVVIGLAEALRAEDSVRAEVDAQVAQARLSALVMALTPLGFGALLVAGDAGARAFLLGSPAGLTCLGVGLILDAAGWAWMQAIASGARR
jgi:tight adherence protein B